MDARMIYLHAISPLHTGTGQSVDVIDLPVAREKATGWPFIPGSSLKGVLRAACENAARDATGQSLVEAAFGPPPERAQEGAGALLFGDGRILCLPVRSLFGTFAWVTSPLALDRYRRDHQAAGLAVPPETGVGAVPDDGIHTAAEPLIADQGVVYLEDLDMTRQAGDVNAIASWIADAVFEDAPWRGHFVSRFGMVSDTTFSFLATVGTEVTARIQLNDETKTVKNGALGYEEAIPTETIFSAPLLAAPRNGNGSALLFGVVEAAARGLLQIGGHAGIGRGLVRTRLAEARP